MCQICGHTVEFFNGAPTGEFPAGTIGFDYSNMYAVWVFNGAWQQVGDAFTGSFQNGGGTLTYSVDVSFFDHAPTGGAPQGQIAFDTSSSPYAMYVFSGGWQQIGSSITAALDLLAICGPNVVFGASNPPPAPIAGVPGSAPPVGTLYIPTGSAGMLAPMYVFYPPGGGVLGGWQPIEFAAIPLGGTVYITSLATTSWTAPSGFNPLNNIVEIMASGGFGHAGAAAAGGLGGGGGGGGEYAKTINVMINAGDTVGVALHWPGQTRLEDNTSTDVCVANSGVAAVGSTGGAGGTGGTGDTLHDGGAGGDGGNSGGGGGGGSAGPAGPGGDGANGGTNGGGGGGGANNGSDGAPGGGDGGDGGAAGGGGLGGLGSAYPMAGQNGNAGGGGGGSGGNIDLTAAPTGSGGDSNTNDNSMVRRLWRRGGGGGSGVSRTAGRLQPGAGSSQLGRRRRRRRAPALGRVGQCRHKRPNQTIADAIKIHGRLEPWRVTKVH